MLQRAGQSRWTKAAEEKFLIELTTSGNVSRAAKAAGFTKATAYKQRMKDRHFTAAWDAAIETGKARVQGYLVEAATRAFDPDELPIGEEAPKVSISEAISIAKLPAREAGAAAGLAKGGRGLEGRTYDETGFDTTPITREEWEDARQNIVNRLQRMRERTEEEERETGLCHCCGQALPDAASEALTLHGFSG